MNEIEGKFLRIKNGIGFAARVLMEITECDKTEIVFNNSIYLENREINPNWLKSAEIAAEYALDAVTSKKYKINIKRIIGSNIETNTTIVGTATIFGIWNALNITNKDNEIERLTNLTFESWKKDWDLIPEYGK